MGIEQHTQGVGGTGGGRIQTNASGVLETDNYGNGGDFDAANSYPLDVDPAETIQELVVTRVATSCELVLSTADGDTVTLPLSAGQTLTADKWEIDSLTVQNPGDATKSVAGGWAGE